MFPTHTLVNNNWLFPLSFLPNKQIVLLVKRYSKQCFSRKLTTDSRAIRTVWCSSLWSLEILTLKTSLPVKAVIHNAPYCSIRLIMVLLWFISFSFLSWILHQISSQGVPPPNNLESKVHKCQRAKVNLLKCRVKLHLSSNEI